MLLIEANALPRDVNTKIERIRALVEEPLAYEGKSVTVKASVGVSAFSGNEKGDELLTRADQLMYADKCARKAGRD